MTAPRPPGYAGEFRQARDITIAVVIIDRDKTDSVGGEVQQGVSVSRQIVECALLGWQPLPTASDIAFAGGQLANLFDNGEMAWQDNYMATHLSRVV